MIVLVHNNKEVVKLYSRDKGTQIDYNPKKALANILYDTANRFPDELLIWVHQDFKDAVNFDNLDAIFHHKLIMTSYAVNEHYSIPEQIGYVEQKPYTNVCRDVSFPTWLMSTDIGGIYAETLNTIKSVKEYRDFGLSLCSFAKQAMPKGLFCYSEPSLLVGQKERISKDKKLAIFSLFKFVRQHYKFIWIINLFMCFVIFENRLPLMSFLRSLIYKRIIPKIDLKNIHVKSKREEKLKREIDVVIPTLGRKECLNNVLKDLANQTIQAINVIIVEQNSNPYATTELDYLIDKNWPFKIKHQFTHQIGACNARNIALNLVESDWCFLADDDIRFDKNLIENAFVIIDKYGVQVINVLCLQPKEKQAYFLTAQTDIFGSGSSILDSSLFNKISFDKAFEFGFGEDSDFGMQIRKQGVDVIFTPDIKITHLKASSGGFRNKVKQPWGQETIQPKPSPTMMLFFRKHLNKYQLSGYKYTLFVKFYGKQNTKNPLRYIKTMERQWRYSIYWSSFLIKENNA